MSWSGVTSTTKSWSASTSSSIGWQQLSLVTEADGVDFVLRVNDQYPMRVNDARPSVVIDDIETP
jgi:hypothetical protein